ncbi:anti-sigma factor family protein, partial [Pseudoduganella ginsengisoli]
MSFSEETLMAYADGELAPPEREQVERAMQGDPELAARVARHQALRSDVFAAFAPVLDEPVPARLAAAALPDKVADLAA